MSHIEADPALREYLDQRETEGRPSARRVLINWGIYSERHEVERCAISALCNNDFTSNRLLRPLARKVPGTRSRQAGRFPKIGSAATLDGRPDCIQTTYPQSPSSVTENETHYDRYRFLPVRCDRSWDHFHRLPLSVGTFNSRRGLGRTGRR